MDQNIIELLSGELQSLRTPSPKDVAPVPTVGSTAPETSQLKIRRGKPAIIVFLRHCGCPFAEKSFKLLTTLSSQHPELCCIAVSNSSPEATERWVIKVGGVWNVRVVADEDRDIYAAWGLGTSSTWHVIPALFAAIRLGWNEGIWNHATESGNRWQTSGAFAVDATGVVRWVRVAPTANDIPDLAEALEAVQPAAVEK